MNTEPKYVDELFDELHELAMWEGCETGDLCHGLMNMHEGCASYASDEFQKVLEKEIRDLYNLLKEQKMEEDMYMIENIVQLSEEEIRELALSKLSEEEKKILGL